MPESLTGLEGDYQVLTELYRSAGSITYLARHLHRARDVTITVVRAGAGEGRIDLSQIEADVKTLMAVRHPSVVSVLEGRWLGSGSFAVVRARVRGSTLDQLVSAIGPVPFPRVRSTLEQVLAALAFGRANGVVSRHVSPESLVFQQGSGRVLVSFEATPNTEGRPPAGEDADVRTIGGLARIMLSGRSDAAEREAPLAEMRPDLEPGIGRAADELVHGGSEREVLEFFSLVSVGAPLTTAVPMTPSAPVTPVESMPAAEERVVTPAVVATPTARERPRRFSARARWATAAGVAIVVIAGVVLAVMQPHLLSSSGTAASSAPSANSPATATGDVSGAKPPQAVPLAAPVAPAVPDSAGRDSTTTPAAAATTTSPDSSVKPAVPVSAPPSNVTANVACASAAPADQRKCFADAVQRSDSDLNRVYAALIAALRRQAKSAPDDPDPPPVDRLRSIQRAWLDERDRSCQAVGAGVFSGRDRGQCFAERAAIRSRDLQAMLDSIPPGGI